MACSTRPLSCATPLWSGQDPAAACSSRISTWAEGKLRGGGGGGWVQVVREGVAWG